MAGHTDSFVADDSYGGTPDAPTPARMAGPAQADVTGRAEPPAVPYAVDGPAVPGAGVVVEVAAWPRVYTARELAALTAGAAPWRVRPFLADGAITELDGKPKAAGKTTFATHLCRALLAGQPFLGAPTRPCPVVYLTEQSAATFREALRRADLLARDDLHVIHWRDAYQRPWPELVAAAVGHARRVGAGVLVVDTVAQFAGLRGEAENSAGAALAAMRPLQAAAAIGLAVLTLHHERKSGGEVGESGRGSSAFAGAVDIVLSLRRGEGHTRPGIRHLHGLSRFDETPPLLVVELTEAGYVAHGTEPAVAAAEAQDAILAALPDDEAAALAEKELFAAAGVSRSTGKRALAELLAAGHLASRGRGLNGDPRRFWRLPAAD